MMITESWDGDTISLMKQLIEGRSYSLLDVGCGLCDFTVNFQVPLILALDAHLPYLINRATQAPHIIPLHMDALQMDHVFLPSSISTVLLSDVIEHFTKEEAISLLQLSEKIASDRVILFTPRGYFPQSNFDHYNLQGECFQEHRSSWEPEEFEAMGYEVIVLKEIHGPENPSFLKAFGPDHPRVDAILAYKERGG